MVLAARLRRSYARALSFRFHRLTLMEPVAPAELDRNNPTFPLALVLLRDALCHRGFLGLGSRESLRFSNQAAAFREVVPEERSYQRL